MRKLAATLLTTAVAGGLVGAVGAGSAVAQTDNQAFCDAALRVDAAISDVEDSGAEHDGAPSDDAVQALDAALTAAEGSAPPEIAADMQSIASIIRSAAQTGEDPFENETFQQNLSAIGEYRFNSCGYQQAEVSMFEYEFDGLPKSFTTGTVAIKLTNDGAEVHELGLARLKTNEPFKKILALPEKKQRTKVAEVGHGFAFPGQTAYMFVELARGGRYGAVCFVPVGSTPETLEEEEHGDGGGKPHWREGMYDTFKVTKASA